MQLVVYLDGFILELKRNKIVQFSIWRSQLQV